MRKMHQREHEKVAQRVVAVHRHGRYALLVALDGKMRCVPMASPALRWRESCRRTRRSGCALAVAPLLLAHAQEGLAVWSR
jgi:hypothetical protein